VAANDEKRTHLPIAPERVAYGGGVLDSRLLQVVQVRRVVHVPDSIRLVVPHPEVGRETRGVGFRRGSFVG
jgi:hypothetical protein